MRCDRGSTSGYLAAWSLADLVESSDSGLGCGGGYGIGHFDGSGRYQVAAAKNAAHGYGIDKVGVGPAVSVHADFCCHL